MFSKIIQAWGIADWNRLSLDEKLRIKHQWEQRRLIRAGKAKRDLEYKMLVNFIAKVD